MVHILATASRAPFGVVLQKLDIEPVQAARGPDVERALADLLDGRDAGERQEGPEMIGEVLVGADDRRIIRRQVLGLDRLPIRRENELGLGLGGRRARLQRREGLRDLADRANGDVNVIGLKDPADVRLVRPPPSEPPDRGFLLSKASRKANGNSSGAKGRSASSEIACSISIGFMFALSVKAAAPGAERL